MTPDNLSIGFGVKEVIKGLVLSKSTARVHCQNVFVAEGETEIHERLVNNLTSFRNSFRLSQALGS